MYETGAFWGDIGLGAGLLFIAVALVVGSLLFIYEEVGYLFVVFPGIFSLLFGGGGISVIAGAISIQIAS